VFGGIDENMEKTNSTWIYHFKENIWHEISNYSEVPMKRSFHGCIITQENDITIFGGQDENNSSLSDCWILRVYNNYSEIWVNVTHKSQQPWPDSNFGHTTVYSKNRMIIAGGSDTNVWQCVFEGYCMQHTHCEDCVVEDCGWCSLNGTANGNCYAGGKEGPYHAVTCLGKDSKEWLLRGFCHPPKIPDIIIVIIIVGTIITIIIQIGVLFWTKNMIENPEEKYRPIGINDNRN